MVKYGIVLLYCSSLFPMQQLIIELHYPKKFDRALAKAVENNKDEEITSAVKQGADLQAQNRSKRTLLHLAVNKQAYESALVLLAEGVDIQHKDYFNKTALALAQKKGQNKSQTALKEFMNYHNCYIDHQPTTALFKQLNEEVLQKMWFKRLCLQDSVQWNELFWIWKQLKGKKSLELIAYGNFLDYPKKTVSILSKRSIPLTSQSLYQQQQLLSKIVNNNYDDLVFVWDGI